MTRLQLSRANTQFALNLYQELSNKNNEGNLFMSPLSISIALAMTYLGSRGNTHAEMKSGLCFQDFDDESYLHQSFADVLSSLKTTDGKFTLHLANRLFGEKSYEFVEEYIKGSLKHYGADLAAVDFAEHPADAVEIINKWVSEQTHDKIPKIVSIDSVNHETRMILINAIYFKGDWKNQFNRDNTQEDTDFRCMGEKTVKVPMMHKKLKINYMADDSLGCQVIELPYSGDRLSMCIMLPDESKTTLSEMESKITVDALSTIQSNLFNADVNVWLPRFKLDEKLSLSKVLTSLGLKDAFTCDADFSGINPKKELYISDAIHQATVEVNEEGTVAAAATAVVMGICMPMAPPVVFDFRADHPFLFMIRDNMSGSILFLGRVTNPQ